MQDFIEDDQPKKQIKTKQEIAQMQNDHQTWKSKLFNNHLKLSEWEEHNCFENDGNTANGMMIFTAAFEPFIDWLTSLK